MTICPLWPCCQCVSDKVCNGGRDATLDLDAIEKRAKATKRVLGIVPLADDVIALAAEVRRLRDEVKETKAIAAHFSASMDEATAARLDALIQRDQANARVAMLRRSSERLLELTAARAVCEAAEKTITTCPCKGECSCAYQAEFALKQALGAWRRAWSDSPAGGEDGT